MHLFSQIMQNWEICMLHHQVAVKVKSNFDYIVSNSVGLLDHIYSKIVIYIACSRLLKLIWKWVKSQEVKRTYFLFGPSRFANWFQFSDISCLDLVFKLQDSWKPILPGGVSLTFILLFSLIQFYQFPRTISL